MAVLGTLNITTATSESPTTGETDVHSVTQNQTEPTSEAKVSNTMDDTTRDAPKQQ